MKLKFRAESKDMIIFGVFSLIVFLLLCLAISNIGSFISNGEFSGINIIPALTDYLALTVILFIISIAAMFMSVQSWFIEREEGIGFSIGAKKEKNYSHWAKDKEIKTGLDVAEVDPLAPKANAGGIPLIMTPKKVWVDNGEYHNLVIGATGSGKTECVVKPLVNLLSKKGESMVITDPKGEIYEKTSEMLRRKGYNIILLNFRNRNCFLQHNPNRLYHQVLFLLYRLLQSIYLLEPLYLLWLLLLF